MKSQKQLANTIGNADESKNKNDLKKYFDKWKDNTIKSYPKSKNPRRSPKKYKNKSINKKNKEQKLLKDAFNKWKQKSTFLPTRNVVQQSNMMIKMVIMIKMIRIIKMVKMVVKMVLKIKMSYLKNIKKRYYKFYLIYIKLIEIH